MKTITNLFGKTNDTTCWSSTCVTCSLGVFETTFTVIIGTSVDDNRSTEDWVFTNQFDKQVLLGTFGNTLGVGWDITQVTDVSLVIFWCTVCFAEWVKVRTSRGTTVGVVTKGVDVETSQCVWVVTFNFPWDGGWLGFWSLFKLDNSANGGITSNDCDCNL